MKLSHKLFALAVASVAVASANADTLKLSQDTTNYSVGNGGAFIASNFVGGEINLSGYSPLAQGDGGFLTYCIEYTEHFVPGGTYSYQLSFGAKNGGASGQTAPNYDGISNATAWLYSEFAKGTLGSSIASFTYSKANLGDLQQAIWFLEGEGGTNNALAQAAIAHEGANWNADNNGAYGVRAINLKYLDGGNAQDQLYYSVPENASTIALLGLALIGIAGFRRKAAK